MIAAFLTLGCTISGFYCLALAMPRHRQALWTGRSLQEPHTRSLRRGGTALLALALFVALLSHGFGYGLLVWCGSLSLGAASVVAAAAWRSSRLNAGRTKRI